MPGISGPQLQDRAARRLPLTTRHDSGVSRSSAQRENMSLPRSRYLFGAISVLILGTAGVTAVVVSKAPFRRNQLTAILEAAGFTEVQIGTFEQKWYPPGFAAGR